MEDKLDYLVDVIMSIVSNNVFIICIILYFTIGFIVMLIWNLMEMRGKDFDEDFFCNVRIRDSMLLIFFWLPTSILVFVFSIYNFLDDKRFVTRLLYKIANIGISKDESYKVLTEAEHSSILNGLDGRIFPAIPILAPTAARVHEIKVKVDQQIKENDIIMIVEAMKMEIPVVAPENGTVGTIEVAVGDLVGTGVLLATLLRR